VIHTCSYCGYPLFLWLLSEFFVENIFQVLFSVNLLTLCTWMLSVCAIWIQLFVVKCAFLFFAMCLSFWRWGSLGMWHCVIGWIFPDVSEDCGSSSGSSSQRRLISSWPAWPWRCQVVHIQWQSTAFQETCIVSSTTVRTSDRACGNLTFFLCFS